MLSILFNRNVKVLGSRTLRKLNKQENSIFNDYVKSVYKNIINLDANVTFRGDIKTSMKKVMFKNKDRYSDFKFYSRLFNIGGKTKNCYTGGQASTIIDVDDVSDNIFKIIFDELFVIFNNYPSHPDIGHKVVLFGHNNPEVFKFFGDQANSPEFLRFAAYLSESERLLIRDYYIYLIHVFGVTNLYYDTPLISTSYSFNVAKDFGTAFSTHNDCIVYVYLITSPFDEVGIDESYLDDFKTQRAFSAFPLIDKTVFPGEKEFSVFGALFPHYIIGIYDMTKDVFIVNSHLFKNGNELDPARCATVGFHIPETYFYHDFKDTMYFKGIHKIGRNFKDLRRI